MKQDRSPATAGEVASEHDAQQQAHAPADGGRHDTAAPAEAGVADRYEAAGAAHRDTPDDTRRDGEHRDVDRRDAPQSPSRRERAGEAARTVGRGASWVREKVAQVVWLVAVACAVVLGAAALMVALDANQANTLVAWVLERARDLDGPFADVFTFGGADGAKKQVLVGWALAAIAYLVVGRIVVRVVKP